MRALRQASLLAFWSLALGVGVGASPPASEATPVVVQTPEPLLTPPPPPPEPRGQQTPSPVQGLPQPGDDAPPALLPQVRQPEAFVPPIVPEATPTPEGVIARPVAPEIRMPVLLTPSPLAPLPLTPPPPREVMAPQPVFLPKQPGPGTPSAPSTPQPVVRAPAPAAAPAAPAAPAPVVRRPTAMPQPPAAPRGMPLNVPRPVTTSQGGITYNLLFPIVGQNDGRELAVRLNNSQGGNGLEINLGNPSNDAPAYAPAPGYAPAPAYAPQPEGWAPEARPAWPPPPEASQQPQWTDAPAALQPDPRRAPTRPAARIRYGLTRQASLEIAPVFVSEFFPPGGIDIGAGLVPQYTLGGHWDVNAQFFGQARFAYQEYTIADKLAAGSRHHRDEFNLAASAGYWLPFDFMRSAVTLGYWGRLVSVANSVPPSLTTPLISAPSQFYQGPRLGFMYQQVVGPGLRFDGELQALPFLAGSGDTTVEAISPLFGYGARVGLAWRPLDRLIVDLAYRYDFQTGYRTDFIHTKHGPALTFSGRF